MTLCSRPSRQEMRNTGVICESCECECEEVAIDESFSDGFGNVTCWSTGSDCCGASCLDGKIFVDSTSFHTARKNHLDKKGNIVIKAGERYRANIKKGYYIDGNGEHQGIYEYYKTKIK